MELTRERSIAARATSLTIPDLSDEQRILRGAGQYAAMCANCHSAPGKPDTELGEGLYPKPPNLYQTSLDAKTIFWVTKHGIKMTGMPAWGRSHDDDTIWNVVAFVMKLKGMSGPQYQDIVAKAPPDDDMQDMPN
ncbi:c-type cytochrome, partial [Acinetobacter baumannii]|uniref:c-type cytochrome n=1 Tax=Acinetobacter baumannii TaxID=470 RepID=UPI001C059EFD